MAASRGQRAGSSETSIAGEATLPDWSDALVAGAGEADEDIGAVLDLAETFGSRLPNPGEGETAIRWQLLARVAGEDLTSARILEAHADALAILAEAGERTPVGRWGVFAADTPGVSLVARHSSQGWKLQGTKSWCSLGHVLDHALVTAQVETGQWRLFAVELRQGSVEASAGSGWVARGLRAVSSGPVHFDDTPARPVGAPGWYLARPGFAWGGMGVASCWYGATVALAERLSATDADRGGDLSALSVGRVDVTLHAARACLAEAAGLVDAGRAGHRAGEMLALRVRSVVADAAERTLLEVGHALGPAPLAFDERHARRVADLEIYVRQHHAERDLVALGRCLRRGDAQEGLEG